LVAVGIDIGSVATKAVAFNGHIVAHTVCPTGWSPAQATSEALRLLQERFPFSETDAVKVATGYGRVSAPGVQKTVTEITCHGRGAYYLNPAVRTVIDIGGQDSKVIQLNDRGNVVDFVMNDKCAAGTGRFLDVMMQLFGKEITDLDALATADTPVRINSMCTVFAESEVISLLAGGESREAVASGLVQAITERMKSLAGRVVLADQVMFTGAWLPAALCRRRSLHPSAGIFLRTPYPR
jgi:(R)-2-hydroxyacyl-CoA dehydratese activating ATPase